ncbi:MAG: hypothetical protein LBQ82_09690 [Treponema sp.]|nr:hypothetical protein [Treponema sp.]
MKKNCNNGKYFQLTVFLFFAGLAALFAQQRADPLLARISAAAMWETNIGDTIRGMPHLQAGSVVLAGYNGSVKSFYMSGTPLWNFDAKGRAVQYIARSYEGATYVCSAAGVFMAVNRVGRELWRLNLGKPISYSPVVGWDGRVFIPLDSTITCRTASGNPLWTLDLESQITFPPVLDKTGSAAAVLRNMDFVKIDQFGTVEKLKLEKLPLMIISIDEESRQSYVLFYQSGEMEKIVFDESKEQGAKLSKSKMKSLPATPSAAVNRGAEFAVILRDGRALLLDSEGNAKWTINTHETVEEKGSGNLAIDQAAIIYDERGVYAVTVRGVSAFTAEGRRRFVHRLQVECSGVPALSDEGLLYACGKDNVLRVYKIDVKPRTIPQTRFYGPEPEGSYGMGNPPPSPWIGDRSRYDDTNQDMVFDEMEKVIKSGQVGINEPIYAAYMMEMIGFFLNTPHYSPVRPAVKPPQRIRLIYLLAQIGSRETVPFFWNIFDKDPEPAVRRACADAIGIIGVDPTGRSFQSYNFLLAPNNPNMDPQLVLAAASSIARLCRFSGPPLAPEGIRVMRYFSNLPSIPNNIRAQIRNEIDALFNEGLDRVIQ